MISKTKTNLTLIGVTGGVVAAGLLLKPTPTPPGTPTVTHIHPGIQDLTGDGVFDNADVQKIKSQVGKAGIGLPHLADLNGDGVVSMSDVVIATKCLTDPDAVYCHPWINVSGTITDTQGHPLGGVKVQGVQQ